MLRPEFLERIPKSHLHILPIVESRPAQRFVIDQEAEGLHQVQMGANGKAQPADIAGIWRDLRLDQDNVEHEMRNPPLSGSTRHVNSYSTYSSCDRGFLYRIDDAGPPDAAHLSFALRLL
jgi:hypothetical protein